MKMKQVYDFYQASEKRFQCPICHAKVRAQEPAAVICANGHCYNLSKAGYINFLPNQKATKYQEKLFESRRVVFANGYYLPLAREICRLIESVRTKEELCLIDAGCGEGYYDCFLQEHLINKEVYAFDSVKEAVRMGAKANKKIRWFVGNLAAIPFASGQADILLDIFAPANYSEFRRVVKEDGYLLKVIPGEQYLTELRACMKKQDDRKPYSSKPVEEYFSGHLRLEARQHLLYQKAVDADMAAHFKTMTPLMFGRPADEIDITGLSALTFEFVLLLGRFTGAASD